MNYQNNVFPLPRGNQWISLFWSQPAPAGLYTTNDGEDVLVITTNQRSHLGSIPESFCTNVLVLEAGGFSPSIATALSVISREKLIELLGDIKKKLIISYLLVPASIARYMQWTTGQEISGMKIQVVSDNSQAWGGKPMKSGNANGINSPILNRIIGMTRLCLGQALIISIPLAMFGLNVLVLGLTSLLAVSIALFFFWEILPGEKNILKGIIVGGMCALGLFLLSSMLKFSNLTIIIPSLAVFISAFWMGSVFNGTRV